MKPALAAVVAALVLAACGTSTPSTSSVQPPASASAAASAAAPSHSSAPTGAGPPACLDAKLLWADALDRLIMANCIDQFDLASVETVWAWDGATWELLSDDGPPANVVTGFGWDNEREVLVRYGGIPLPQQECSPETWEWDTTAWHRVGANAPSPCDHIEMAWDTTSGRMLMVGGGRAQNLIAGTWTISNGSTWSELTAEGPAPRAHHALAGVDMTFLYGGLDTTHLFDDLWRWDGTAWSPIAVEGDGPGPRSHHGLAIGPDGILLFGGATQTSTFTSLVDETWLLADGVWSLLEGPGPSARGLPALGYDWDRDVYVLHGGFDATGAPLADTWEWDGAWSCVAGC